MSNRMQGFSSYSVTPMRMYLARRAGFNSNTCMASWLPAGVWIVLIE